MTGFVYRLQAVLDQRRERKQRALEALALAEQELRAEQQAMEECARAQQRALAALDSARGRLFESRDGQPLTTHTIRMRKDHIRRMEGEAAAAADEVATQRRRVRTAEEGIARARAGLTEASRDVELLERHQERLASRFRREQERKEALEHDEVGNAMFLQRRREA